MSSVEENRVLRIAEICNEQLAAPWHGVSVFQRVDPLANGMYMYDSGTDDDDDNVERDMAEAMLYVQEDTETKEISDLDDDEYDDVDDGVDDDDDEDGDASDVAPQADDADASDTDDDDEDDMPLEHWIFSFTKNFEPVRVLHKMSDRMVYQVINRTQPERHCVITISRRQVGDEGVWPREVIAMANMQHDNVVELLGATNLDPHTYAFLTPYYLHVAPHICIDGEPILIQRFMNQLCQAVKHVADKGWLHRDIAMDNIRWNPVTQHLVLIDFDVAAPVKEYTYVVGQDLYYSPEKRLAMVDPYAIVTYGIASDIFAMGIVHWILVHNEPEPAPLAAILMHWSLADHKQPINEFGAALCRSQPQSRLRLDALLTHAFFSEAYTDHPERQRRLKQAITT